MPDHIEVEGVEGRRVVFGANQPEYRPLPGVIVDEQTGCVVTRWEFSDEEREAIAGGAVLEYRLLTFGHPFPPVLFNVVSLTSARAPFDGGRQ